MAKSDCSEYDVVIAELAMYIARDPKMNTVAEVAKEMSRLTDQDIHPHIVADAVSLYFKKGQAKAQDEIAKNMTKISKESRAITGNNKELERARAEVESGVFTKPSIRTKKALTETLQALENALKPLKAIKVSELHAQHFESMFEILKGGGVIPEKFRTA